jgi:hypothetical protein
MHMKLSDDQRKAIEQGQPLELQDSSLHFVVLRADLRGQYRSVIDHGLPDTVISEIVDETMIEYDADDPLLASYQPPAS